MTDIFVASIEDAYLLSEKLPELKLSDFNIEHLSEKRKKSLLGGRALLQHILSCRYNLKQLPVIEKLEHGKPYFFDHKGIFFNISHSTDWIVIAVGGYHQGIDLEFVKKRHDFEGLKARVLSPLECAWLDKFSLEDQMSEFTRLWTIKECLIKVSGLGLVGISDIRADLENHRVESRSNDPGVLASLRFDEIVDAGLSWLTYYFQNKSEKISLYQLSDFDFKEVTPAANIHYLSVN